MKHKFKAKPIFGLDKIPPNILLKNLNIELGKQKAYITELEYKIECLENKLLQNPNKRITELEKQLSIALKGTKTDKKLIRNELYKDAYLKDLINYKEKADKLIKKLLKEIKSQRINYRNTINNLLSKNTCLKN